MSGRAREDYVRPPIVGREPSPRWVARWRFRVVVSVIAIGLAVIVALLVLKYVINTEQNPSFGTSRAIPAIQSSAER